jgi:hypothetical protein
MEVASARNPCGIIISPRSAPLSILLLQSTLVLRNRKIICVSTIDWNFLWQEHSRRDVGAGARREPRALHREHRGALTRIERPGQVIARLRKWLSGEGRLRTVADNVTLYSPLALPFPYSPLSQRINRTAVGGSIRRWIERNRFEEPSSSRSCRRSSRWT